MSAGALRELRPRSPSELYDAVLHLCVHTRSALPALAFLGAAPLAASTLWLGWLASHGQPVALAAAATSAAWVFRQLCQGAGGLAASRELEGQPLSARAALATAFKRLPSFITCTLWLACVQWLLFPVTLGWSVWGFAEAPLGPVLIAEGSAHGWNFLRVARTRITYLRRSAALIRLLHGVALLLLLVNLHGLFQGVLYGCHTLLAIDVTFVRHFATLSHGFYALCLLVFAQLLLEPVRCAGAVLLLADARVRHEGFDLLAALRRLREPAVRAASLLLLVLAAVSARPARADAPAHDPVAELHAIANELELDEGALAPIGRLDPAERAQLSPLVRSLQAALAYGDRESARRQLEGALAQAGRLANATPPALGDPRQAAKQILSAPEFQPDPTHVHKGVSPPHLETPTWWTRFWKWVGKLLEEYFKRHPSKPAEPSSDHPFALQGGLAEVITSALVVLAAFLVLGIIYWLANRRRAPIEALAGSAPSDGSGPLVDALAKTALAWSHEADALAAQGRFREAIRSLYLALLASLHRRGAIDYHPTLSNWSYCDHFRGTPDELPPFREVTLRFDFGWYGRLGADADGYARFRSLCGPLLQSAQSPEATGA